MGSGEKTIAVAGATGALGTRIVRHLLKTGVQVRALVRSDSDRRVIREFTKEGVDISEVDYNVPSSLVSGCRNASCVVSALSGVEDVIVSAQTALLTAAVKAAVPKFIPSDYCIDYRLLKPGRNRNLDLRRRFSEILTHAPIQVTSILNGMFTDLLDEKAPVILKNQNRIFFWGNAHQKMDFTSMDNTAEFTAYVALDDDSPRWLMIAGDVASMEDIRNIASIVYKKEFKMLRPGGLGAFQALINVTKVFAPGKREAFPAWQGMQYLHDMLSGIPKLTVLDNDRYRAINWTSIRQLLQKKE